MRRRGHLERTVRRRRKPSRSNIVLARAKFVWVVLFFVIGGVIWADDESLRKALDQLSASYAETQSKLRDREIALKALTESLAIAKTESELIQNLWADAQARAQTVSANLTEPDAAAIQWQLVETLHKLYLAETEQKRLLELLKRLVSGVESNRNIVSEIIEAKQLLAEKPIGATKPSGSSSLVAARILEVNPKLRLVVFDVGVQQGARIGMPLIIFCGDHAVAELRVVDVRQKICGAVIENMDNNVTLKAGDTARVTKG